MFSRALVLNLKEGDFGPQGTFGNVWKHFGMSQLERGLLLACRGQRPGILLSTVQDSPHSRASPRVESQCYSPVQQPPATCGWMNPHSGKVN